MTVTAMSVTVPTVPPAPCTATLHFSAPARCTVTQTVPLPNPSLTPWQWKVRLDGDQWRGEAQVSTAPKQTSLYRLSFHCHAVGQQCKGLLVFRNRVTGDELSFTLLGDTTEPLAEPPAVLHAQAGQWTTHSVTVANDSPALLEYQIESDLPQLSSAPTLRVPPQSSSAYAFSVRPLLAGDFPACLAFSAYYDGRLVQRCFPLHLQVRPPQPSSTVTLRCRCHASVTAELEVTNPSTTQPAAFAVEWTGADIDGPPTLTVPPSSSAIYPLTFAPLRPGQQSGAISFLHPEHGEAVHSLILHADDAETVELQPMKVELGRTEETTVWVQNVLDEEVTLSIRLTNRHAFEVKPASLTLAAAGLGHVTVRYSPTRLHEAEECALLFSHTKAGEWRYHIRCTGLAPLTPFPSTGFAGLVQQTVERTIAFRNPHTAATAFAFTLQPQPQPSPFVLSPPNGVPFSAPGSFAYTVPALSTLPVSVAFCAPLIESYSSALLVTQTAGSSALCWQYPLTGVGGGAAGGRGAAAALPRQAGQVRPPPRGCALRFRRRGGCGRVEGGDGVRRWRRAPRGHHRTP